MQMYDTHLYLNQVIAVGKEK